MIIAIEGLDASGKATQSKRLADHLDAALFSFPDYTTPTGKILQSYFRKEWAPLQMDPKSVYCSEHAPCEAAVVQSLMSINRLEVRPNIIAALQHDLDVVLDRYTASAAVYGKLDGLDPAWVGLIQPDMPAPDLQIFLDIPVEESFRRRPERRDRYESDRQFLERARAEYRSVFDLGEAHRQNLKPIPGTVWAIIDGLGTPNEVFTRILRVVDLRRSQMPQITITIGKE